MNSSGTTEPAIRSYVFIAGAALAAASASCEAPGDRTLDLGPIDTVTSALVDDHVITIGSAQDVTNKRNALINFIWGSPGFPASNLPASVTSGAPNPVPGLPNLLRVDDLNVSMTEGQVGLVHHFVPINGNNRSVVLHQGHACTFNDDNDGGMRRTIEGLLAQGFHVLAVYMQHMTPSDCSGSHDAMFGIATTGSPMKFFLEPVAVAINHVTATTGITDFNMVGLSGGGWTTTVYSAVDPRIRMSFPVAGTVPLSLRYEGYNHDLEQYLAAFYQIAGYPDLYVLGGFGSGRRQVQILNRHDDCCFGEGSHNFFFPQGTFDPMVRDYEFRVKSALLGAGSGAFRVVIDETAPWHQISAYAVSSVIVPTLNGATTLPTTIRSVGSGNLCVDVPDWGRPPQAWDRPQIWACHGNVNQEFNLQADGTIRTQWGGLCLDVPDWGRPPQAWDLIQLFPCHGNVNQQFDLLSDGTIQTRWAGLCLDVPDYGRPPQNADPIQLYWCHGGPNQQFNVNR